MPLLVWKIPKTLCLSNISQKVSRWNFETSSKSHIWKVKPLICILKTLVTFSGATFPCEISSKRHFRSPRLNSKKTFQDPKSPHLWYPIFPLLQKTNFILAKMKTVFSPKNSSSSSVFPLPWFFPYRVFFSPTGGFLLLCCIFYSRLYRAVNKDHYYCTVVKESKSAFGIQLLSDFVLLSSHAIACE